MLRAERQRAIASNIANADTPGYVARDFNFREALTRLALEIQSFSHLVEHVGLALWDLR